MSEYLAMATLRDANGSEKELQGVRTTKMYEAYQALRVWKEQYGEAITGRRIEVYGKVRRKYTITITE